MILKNTFIKRKKNTKKKYGDLKDDYEKLKKKHDHCGKESDQSKDLSKKIEIYINQEEKYKSTIEELNITINKYSEIERDNDDLKKKILVFCFFLFIVFFSRNYLSSL